MYKVHVRRTVVLAVVGLAAGLIIAFVSPNVYEGTVEMLLGSNMGNDRATSEDYDPEVQSILNRNNPQGVQTERQLLSSETVFYSALNKVDPKLLPDWQRFYKMYDVVTARTPNPNEQGAGVAQVKVRAYSPRQAQLIANAVTEAYNEIRRKAASESVNDAINYLKTQIDATQQQLTASEDAYQAYKEKIRMASMDRALVDETDFQHNIRSSLESARSDYDGVDSSIQEMMALIAQMPDEIPDSSSSVRNPLIDQIQADVAKLETERANLLAQYTEKNPKVIQNTEALNDARKRLEAAKQDPTAPGYDTTRTNPKKTELENNLANAKAKRAELQGRIDALQAALDQQDQVLADTPAKEVKINQLQRDRSIFDLKYRRLKAQLEELQNRKETGPRAAVVMGEGARAEDEPVAPDKIKFAFIGFLAGASIGLVFSFALESLRPRVYTSSQLADLTGLPVVASLPGALGVSRSKAIESLSNANAAPMESFRNMAYTYLAAGASAGQSVLFTGIGSAGSSSISAAQFAVALAQAGIKVVLVDAERTRQVVTNGFRANDKRGISNAFHEGSDPTELLIDTKHEHLKLLPIGTVPDALASHADFSKVEAIVAALRAHAQMVVIAVSPADVLADAAAFASRVDEVCLSVSAKTNEYSSVPMAYEILHKAGAKSIKLVLTDSGKDGEPFSTPSSIQRAG
ncbi:MAG TPA: hypothetical protein VNI20_07890 [Fimbriimonadaceae bacterium]|nr:hypothetical protein [Fimbriimonadaceae bacterium]